MTMELAIKAVNLGSWGACGNRMPADRVGAALGFSVGRERVTIFTGSTYGASLRLARVACSDSAQSPARAKRKRNVDGSGKGPTKPELKLLKDLQDFIASCDLPPSEVPTTAELARRGRQDLANRVRRKGHKQVVQLLEQVRTAETGESTQREDVKVRPNGSVVNFDQPLNLSLDVTTDDDEADDTVSIDVGEPSDVGSSTDGALQGLPLSTGSTTERANLNGHASRSEALVREASWDQGVHFAEVGRDYGRFGEAAGSTLLEELFEDRNQDTSEDISGSTQPLDLSLDVTIEDEGDSSIEEVYETDDVNEDDDEDEEDEEDYADVDDDDDGATQITDRPDPKSQSPDIVYQKATLLKAKLLQYFDSRSAGFKEANSFPYANRMKQEVAPQQEWGQTDLGDFQSQVTQKFEAPKDLEHLKGLLYSRELELAEVSKQLEEARAMLSLARAKATAELVHVKQLTVEQDARLQAAEQTLSQMKQVHLEWWGEAGHVELAGSFNGWQHYILLEPDFSSEIPKPDGTRGPMMWGTHLCLYPGVYEIKFIVDGNWQVDHRREVETRQSNQNNILRVA